MHDNIMLTNTYNTFSATMTRMNLPTLKSNRIPSQRPSLQVHHFQLIPCTSLEVIRASHTNDISHTWYKQHPKSLSKSTWVPMNHKSYLLTDIRMRSSINPLCFRTSAGMLAWDMKHGRLIVVLTLPARKTCETSQISSHIRIRKFHISN